MSSDVEVRWDRLTASALRDAVKDRQHLKTRSAVGVLGEAWAATPEKGQRLLAAISQDVADALADQRLWEAPI